MACPNLSRQGLTIWSEQWMEVTLKRDSTNYSDKFLGYTLIEMKKKNWNYFYIILS